MKSIIFAAALIIGLLTISTGETNAWPKHRSPVITVSKPGLNYIWVEGHWKINKHGKRVWVPGHWKKV